MADGFNGAVLARRQAQDFARSGHHSLVLV